jgi:LEA14-like dessication related protein
MAQTIKSYGYLYCARALYTLIELVLRRAQPAGGKVNMNCMYKAFAAALLCGLALLTGCNAEPFSLARQLNLQAPSLNAMGYSLVSAADNRIVADTALTLHNPNNLSIGLSRLQAEALVNDVKVADIAQAGTATLAAQGDGVVNLRVTAYTDQLGTVLAGHINRGESSSLTLRGSAFIGSGWFSFPYPFTYTRNLKTDMPARAVLKGERKLPLEGLSLTGLNTAWGTVTGDSLQLIHDVRVLNSGQQSYTLYNGAYEVLGNGVALADGLAGGGVATVNPGENSIQVVNTLNARNIAPWLATHLQQGEKTTFELRLKPGARLQQGLAGSDKGGRTFSTVVQTDLASELMKQVKK